jgi:hypothetical protein
MGRKYVISFIKKILEKFRIVVYEEVVIISKKYIYFWFLLAALHFSQSKLTPF